MKVINHFLVFQHWFLSPRVFKRKTKTPPPPYGLNVLKLSYLDL